MNLDLKGKVVVITGPAKGMGRAVTLAFAREGARLVLAGRDTAAIEEVAGELAAMGAESLVVKCDMTRSEQTERVATEALAHFGSIDVLVNVAGGSGPIGKTGWETTQAEFDDIVQLNMTG
ncbi:MAG: SDR family NAD(P)-dependent oxidoreductase, partial [Pseudoalteromonas distincta]